MVSEPPSSTPYLVQAPHLSRLHHHRDELIGDGVNTSLLPTPSFGHVVNAKLGRENYLLWKAQLLPFLRGQQLLGYVDGSPHTPPPMISETVGDEVGMVPNPAHQVWVQQDQLVLSSLLSSLSPEVIAQVLFLATSAEIWSSFERMFSQTKARIMQVRMQLANTHKKDMSGAEYFAMMKTLADQWHLQDSPILSLAHSKNTLPTLSCPLRSPSVN